MKLLVPPKGGQHKISTKMALQKPSNRQLNNYSDPKTYLNGHVTLTIPENDIFLIYNNPPYNSPKSNIQLYNT